MSGLKRSVVKRIIERKLKLWLDTLPPELHARVSGHIVVSGGCIASLLLGEPVKDFDIYCDNIETTELLARHYVQIFNDLRPRATNIPNVRRTEDRVSIFIQSEGVAGDMEDPEEEVLELLGETIEGYIETVSEKTAKRPEKNSFTPVFLSENAITLSDKLQIVIRFYGNPDEIHENYDYVHATNYYWSQDNSLVLRPLALEALLSKTLVYTGSLYPICSLFRMRKFMDRGWRITAGEILKMSLQISKLDLSDYTVLREQLVGVDAAYFHQLLRLISEHQETAIDGVIDTNYVMQLIDELADQNHI